MSDNPTDVTESLVVETKAAFLGGRGTSPAYTPVVIQMPFGEAGASPSQGARFSRVRFVF
jgi:hypothetical protein